MVPITGALRGSSRCVAARAVEAPTSTRSPAPTGSVKTRMTLTEKILGKHTAEGTVKAGDNVWVNVDKLLTHDVCGPGTFGVFENEFGSNAKVRTLDVYLILHNVVCTVPIFHRHSRSSGACSVLCKGLVLLVFCRVSRAVASCCCTLLDVLQVWNNEGVILIPDHYIFTNDPRANRNVDLLREYARKYNIKHFYDITDRSDFQANPDYKGVCHVALAQEGHAIPGEVLFGTDSHTCNAGAFGMFATGIGNTDAGFILGTGKLLIKVPHTIKFNIVGEKPSYILAKDLILQIIGEIGVRAANDRATCSHVAARCTRSPRALALPAAARACARCERVARPRVSP
jgi:homoaconitase/3-isopropylmalate dehydratase large subunit